MTAETTTSTVLLHPQDLRQWWFCAACGWHYLGDALDRASTGPKARRDVSNYTETDAALEALARKIGADDSCLEAIADRIRELGWNISDTFWSTDFPHLRAALRDIGRVMRDGRNQLAGREHERKEIVVSQTAEGGGKKTPSNAGLAIKAHKAAITRLIEAHREEFDEMHRKERVDRGLPERPELKGGRALDALREQLRAAGLEPIA